MKKPKNDFISDWLGLGLGLGLQYQFPLGITNNYMGYGMGEWGKREGLVAVTGH